MEKIEEKPPQEEHESDQEEWVGPLPSEATEPEVKKRKILHHEKLFLEK